MAHIDQISLWSAGETGEAGDPFVDIALISAHLEMQMWKNDIIFDNLELPQICKKHFKGESTNVSSWLLAYNFHDTLHKQSWLTGVSLDYWKILIVFSCCKQCKFLTKGWPLSNWVLEMNTETRRAALGGRKTGWKGVGSRPRQKVRIGLEEVQSRMEKVSLE